MTVEVNPVDGGNTSTASPNIQLRSGGAAASAGDLVVVLLGYDGTGTVSNANGFTSLKDESFTGATAKIFYLKCSGGETTWSPTMSASERWAAIVYYFPAADWHGTSAPEVVAKATGSSTTPDPPSLTPSWGSDGGVNTHYIASVFADDSSSPFPITAWPTNYSLLQAEAGGDAQTSSCEVAAAMRDLSAASDNPGTFTMTSTETWAAYTVAVRGPVAAGGNVTVTPGVATLTLSPKVPTVTASDHKTATPGVVALALSPKLPTVTVAANQTATPDQASLSLTSFAPAVSASDHQTVTPVAASLALSPKVPTVTASDHKVVTPSALAILLNTFAPTVSAGDNVTATPSVAALLLSLFAPTVTATDPQVASITRAGLALEPFAPTVTVSANVLGTATASVSDADSASPSVSGGTATASFSEPNTATATVSP